MTSSNQNDELRPANDAVPPEEIDRAIDEVMTRARYAWDWCVANEFEEKARPLNSALKQTRGYSIKSSADIGEAGFALDETSRTIYFSSQAIGLTILLSSIISPKEKKLPLWDRPIAMSILTLYIFHELTHISQLFVSHDQAQMIKRTLGKQFLAIIDTRTDVKSAHCASIINCSYSDDKTRAYYVSVLLENTILAFRALTGAFSVADAEHKQQRALGLLCTIAICEAALESEREKSAHIFAVAASPMFAGYDKDTKCILCVNLDTSDIVFTSKPFNNYTTAEIIWNNIESTEISSAKTFLRSSYEEYVSENEERLSLVSDTGS